jgi:mannose-6-phosphate isomerase-like protein (cupin superfamily)
MNIKAYIESGVLELYVLGDVTEATRLEVEALKITYPEIGLEIAQIELALERHGQINAVAPHSSLKPLVLATLEYVKRLESGEEMCFPKVMDEHSTPADFEQWLNSPVFSTPEFIEDISVKIISAIPDNITAIVWINHMAADETHHDEYEKFLVLEGSCHIVVEGLVNELLPGDYFQIPLHKHHEVIVTSSIPCKVILQRIAA